MKFQLPDNLFDKAAVLGAKLGVEPETVIKHQLQKWGELNPTKRVLILDGALLDQLEAKLGQVVDGTMLVAKIDRIGSLSFMGKDLRLSTNQLLEIQRRAERQGKSVDDLLLRVWDDFAYQFFDHAMGATVVDRPYVSPLAPVNGHAKA